MDNINMIYDEEYSSVLEHALDLELLTACEAEGKKEREPHILTKQQRAALPDKAFGIPGSRKYPLIIESDKETSMKLIRKAVQMFHFCKPEWREELAKNILKAIKKLDIGSDELTINHKSQILKFAKFPDAYINRENDLPDSKKGFK